MKVGFNTLNRGLPPQPPVNAVAVSSTSKQVASAALAVNTNTSARFMPASEAKDMGLVNFIHERDDIEAACIEYATTIAGNAPLTVQAAKAALNAWERGGRQDEVEAVRAMIDDCFNSEDYKEGRKAFAAKRKPNFKNC